MVDYDEVIAVVVTFSNPQNYSLPDRSIGIFNEDLYGNKNETCSTTFNIPVGTYEKRFEVTTRGKYLKVTGGYNSETIQSITVYYEMPISRSSYRLSPVQLSKNVSDTAPSPQSETGNSGWISDGDKEYQVITITATDNWQTVLENLAVSDSSGNAYYYWVEEINANNSYEVSYKFEDGDEIGSDTDTAINALTPGDGVATIKNNYKESTGTAMPSTGGTGTQPYKVIGFAMVGGALIMLGIRRRKKHC